MNLYHVSEQSDIKVFEPRMPPSASVNLEDPVVWAVSEDRLANYLLPRDCPRVCMRAGASTSKLDQTRFLGASKASAIIVVEECWQRIARDTVLFLYRLPTASFRCLDLNAGYYVSRESVTPLAVEILTGPLQKLAELGVEIRISEDLRTLAAEVAASSIAFSIIRLRNARTTGPRTGTGELTDSS